VGDPLELDRELALRDLETPRRRSIHGICRGLLSFMLLPVRRVRRGFASAPPAERAAFGMLSSCALAIDVARTISYVRERRRTAPRLRSLVRRTYHAPGSQQVRVHHFLPGMLVSAVAGSAAILTRKDGLEFWLSVPFGVGTGLTLDEFALLVELDDPYWKSETFALAGAAGAALAASPLLVHFHHNGRDEPATCEAG